MPAVAPRAQELFRQGRALAREGRWDDATAVFRQVVALEPGHPGALGHLGLAAFRRGRLAESERWLFKALEATPRDAVLHQNLGLLHKARGDYEAALQALDRALALKPDLPMAHLHRGLACVALSRFDEAAECLARATALNPNLGNPRALRQAPEDVRNTVAELERARVRALAGERRRRLEQIEARYAGEDLGRVREFVELLNGQRRVEWPDPRQRPSWMFFPGLEPRPWFEREEFDWVPGLERAAPRIREELKAVLSRGADLAPYVANRGYLPEDWQALADSTDWSAYHLYKGGERSKAHCEACPVTAEVVESLPLIDCAGHAPEAFFSILKPGTRIPPHVGLANTKLAVHLALMIPHDCSITVGGETRSWEEDRVLVFDDSFKHEALNASDRSRAVLIVEVWNPQLGEAEREAVRQMIEANTMMHERWSESARSIREAAQRAVEDHP